MKLKNLTKKRIIILLVIFILIFLIGCMPQLPDNLKKLKNNPIIKKELEFCPAFQACQFYSREIKDDRAVEMLLDTCMGDFKDWKIDAGKISIEKIGSETGRRTSGFEVVTPIYYEYHQAQTCFKGSLIGENVNHYYCTIILRKESITDESGKVLVEGIKKKVFVEYDVNKRHLINYTCFNEETYSDMNLIR